MPIQNLNGGIDYKLSSKLYYIEFTSFPDEIEMKKPFKVLNDVYKLRVTPTIDDTTSYWHREELGNTIAEYSKGAKGLALAESTEIGWMSSTYLQEIE